jgi:DNA-binding transcriptional ArsR family regulator
MDDLTIRRRSRLKNHYTVTSNVLLFGYKELSDGAKLTYQVIDSFDWSDGAGLRKGFAYPSIGRLAEIRGVDARTIQRHLSELGKAGLVTRREQAGKRNLLIIEDPSAAETQAYLGAFGGGGGDDIIVTPTPDKSVTPLLKEEKERKRQISLTRFKEPLEQERGKTTFHISELVRERVERLKELRAKSPPMPEARAKREYLAAEMVRVLGDPQSLGCYRRIAETSSPSRIREMLGAVVELSHTGRVRRSKGALFVRMARSI